MFKAQVFAVCTFFLVEMIQKRWTSKQNRKKLVVFILTTLTYLTVVYVTTIYTIVRNTGLDLAFLPHHYTNIYTWTLKQARIQEIVFFQEIIIFSCYEKLKLMKVEYSIVIVLRLTE